MDKLLSLPHAALHIDGLEDSDDVLEEEFSVVRPSEALRIGVAVGARTGVVGCMIGRQELEDLQLTTEEHARPRNELCVGCDELGSKLAIARYAV